MKTIFKSILCSCALALCTAPMSGCSDSDEGTSGGAGFWDVSNPAEGSELSRYGETVTVSFTTNAGWDLDTKTSDGGEWVEIKDKKNSDTGGKGSIRMSVLENTSDQSRSAEIYVTVKGNSRALLCTLTQAGSSSTKIDEYLITKMHERLLKEYLWNTNYKALSENGQISRNTTYDNFLYTNLTKLGDTNIEDGGYYRDNYAPSYRGKRYIYSFIQEIGGSRAAMSAPTTRASNITSLGIGPTNAMVYNTETKTNCLSIGYVFLESPAAEAGLRRGDMIIGVNGVKLSPDNYSRYQQELYTTASGTYELKYARYKDDGQTLVEYSTTVTAGSFEYNPVLFAGQITNNKEINVGYMVLESFDIDGQTKLMNQLQDYANKGIKDMILDLRFNPGGSVAQCRYLMSAIVGKANYDKTFAKMTFNDKQEEIWSFGYGNPAQSDGLGQGPDLGLTRLYVIGSENTGSAAEMVINSLKGIDFEVNTYGSRTEGKNVGMVTTQLVYDGRRFEFAPITFWVKNAKDFGDYANGFEPDHMVNNQNTSYTDDIDRIFPYNATDWGNLQGADPSLTWAIMNATTGEDPDFNTTAASAKYRTLQDRNLQIMQNIPIKPAMGRFGNVIYGTQSEE